MYFHAELWYICHFASYSSQSRGVAILFNNNFEFKVKKVYKDTGGNFMFISLTAMRRDLLLVNVFSPKGDSPEFYARLEDHANEMGLTDIITGEDLNLALSPYMDYCNCKHVNNPAARERVENGFKFGLNRYTERSKCRMQEVHLA